MYPSLRFLSAAASTLFLLWLLFRLPKLRKETIKVVSHKGGRGKLVRCEGADPGVVQVGEAANLNTEYRNCYNIGPDTHFDFGSSSNPSARQWTHSVCHSVGPSMHWSWPAAPLGAFEVDQTIGSGCCLLDREPGVRFHRIGKACRGEWCFVRSWFAFGKSSAQVCAHSCRKSRESSDLARLGAVVSRRIRRPSGQDLLLVDQSYSGQREPEHSDGGAPSPGGPKAVVQLTASESVASLGSKRYGLRGSSQLAPTSILVGGDQAK